MMLLTRRFFSTSFLLLLQHRVPGKTPIAATSRYRHPTFTTFTTFTTSYGRRRLLSTHSPPPQPPPPHASPTTKWTTPKVLLLSALTGLGTYSLCNSHINTVITPPPQYGSPKNMLKAIEEIKQTLKKNKKSSTTTATHDKDKDDDDAHGVVCTDEEVLLSHGYSAWSTVNVDCLPIAVVYPTSTEEVAQIVRICERYRVPMIPFSGGSSLEGNIAAPFGGVSIDFSLMDKIVEFHQDDMDIVVQPAVSWMELNEKIKDSGLFFPVDPGPSARIGGMVGTNCSGTNAVRYGTMKDWVINLTVVLADGTIIKTRKRPRKSSAGYNLNNLFVGSEGTLGIVTEITLKLAVIPEETSIAVVAFPSVRDAAAVAAAVMRRGIPVAAMEIMDEVQMMVVNKAGGTKRKWEEKPTLFFKFSGTKAGVQENIVAVGKIAKQHGAGKFEFAKTIEEQKKLWSARKEALWSMMALREKGQEVWSTDVAVPLSRLADLIEISKKELDSLGLFAGVLGHIGDGNFHESILYDKSNEGEAKAIKKVVGDMVDRALDMEGTCTGEHGVGIGKKEYLVKELGNETLDVMRRVKAALDPLWLMNPGKVVDFFGK